MMSKKDHLKIDPKLCEIIGGPRTLTAFQVNGFVEGWLGSCTIVSFRLHEIGRQSNICWKMSLKDKLLRGGDVFMYVQYMYGDIWSFSEKYSNLFLLVLEKNEFETVF